MYSTLDSLEVCYRHLRNCCLCTRCCHGNHCCTPPAGWWSPCSTAAQYQSNRSRQLKKSYRNFHKRRGLKFQPPPHPFLALESVGTLYDTYIFLPHLTIFNSYVWISATHIYICFKNGHNCDFKKAFDLLLLFINFILVFHEFLVIYFLYIIEQKSVFLLSG